MTEGAFEARKWGWRQTKEGIIVSFLIHPNDINADLAVAPLGTIYAIGFREMPDGDVSNQETAGRDGALPPPASPDSAEAQGRDKPRRAFHTLRRSQQAGMLCADERFQDWADQHLPYLGGGCGIPAAERTAQQVRVRCGVKSRAELDTDAKAARHWDTVVSRFRADTGQMAEERA